MELWQETTHWIMVQWRNVIQAEIDGRLNRRQVKDAIKELAFMLHLEVLKSFSKDEKELRRHLESNY